MIRRGESMLLRSGRASVLAALLMFLIAPVQTGFGQEDHSASSSQQAETDHDQDGPDHAGEDHAGEEHADEVHVGGEHGDAAHGDTLLSIDIGSAICNLAIFIGVLLILSWFVWPAILGGLQAREQKIHGDLEAAEQANQEAKTLLAEYQSKLDDAATQVQSLLATARKDAEASGQRIVDAAKEEAERQRERSLNEIETAKKVALSELAGQTSDMAISVAKQVVGRELKSDDHADLIRQALERMPSNN